MDSPATTAPAPEANATESTSTTHVAETSAKKSNRNMIIAIAILVILLLIGLGVGIAWFMSNANSTNTNQSAGNSSSSASSITANTNNGTELTDAQQISLFENLATTFTTNNRPMRITTTSSNGDSYVYEINPTTGITGYTGTVGGQVTAAYTTNEGQYFKMDGVWYFMPKSAASTDTSVAPETPDYSDSDFVISDEADIQSKTTYQGATACPGTYQGTCYKFAVSDTSGGSTTVYFNSNQDLVYSTTTDSSGTTTSDYSYDNINISLPSEALNAVDYNDYIQSLINGGL